MSWSHQLLGNSWSRWSHLFFQISQQPYENKRELREMVRTRIASHIMLSGIWSKTVLKISFFYIFYLIKIPKTTRIQDLDPVNNLNSTGSGSVTQVIEQRKLSLPRKIPFRLYVYWNLYQMFSE